MRGIAFGALQKIVQTLCPFITRTALIYCLGVEYLGLNSLFASVLQVLNLAELGVGSALVFSMYKPIAEGDDVALCALMRLYRMYYRVIGLAVLILGIALMPFLPGLIAGSIPADVNLYVLYLLNLAATALSYWLFAYRNSLLNAHQRMDVVSKVTLVTLLVQYVFQVLVLVLFGNYYLFVIVALLAQVVDNVATALVTKRMYPNLKPIGTVGRDERRAINVKIRDLFTGQLGYVVTTAGNSLVVSAILGLAVLGVYQNYMLVATSVAGLFTVAFNSMQAGIGNAFIVDSREGNFNRFKTVCFIVFAGISVCAGCMAGAIQPFMEVWVGPDVMLDNFAVVELAAYFIAYEIVMLLSMFKNAAGMWHPDRFRPAVSGITNIVLSYALAQFMGVDGVLLALAITTWAISVTWIVRNTFVYVLKVPFREWALACARYIALSVACAVASALVCAAIPVSGITGLLLKFVAALVVSLAIFFVASLGDVELEKAAVMVNSACGGRLSFVLRAVQRIQR